MKFLDVSAASQIAEKELSRTYSEHGKVTTLSPCFASKFWFSHVAGVSCCTLSMIFSWWWGGGAFHTLSSLLFWVGHRGLGTSAILSSCAIGEKTESVKLKSPSNFPIQSFLCLSCLSCFKPPSLLSRDFPPTFSVQFLFSFSSCFLFLYTLRPFQIVLLIKSCGASRREIRRFVGRRV